MQEIVSVEGNVIDKVIQFIDYLTINQEFEVQIVVTSIYHRLLQRRAFPNVYIIYSPREPKYSMLEP